jgi:hypothetical protein
MNGGTGFGVWRVTRFYVPLLLQAFSQSLSYPLVGSIVAHGPLGVDALTGFAQGQAVMFMIGLLGGGLITTGMVYARDWSGYRAYCRLNAWMMIALLILQCVPALHPLDAWTFRGALNLRPDLAEIARWTLVWGVVMNGLFFLRNVPLVVLFNNLESGKANNATFARIGLTLACSALFPRFGLVGPWWGLTAMTAGVMVEWLVTWWYARPYVRALADSAGEPPQRGVWPLVAEQFRFMVPLSLGSFVLAISPLALAAFVGRSSVDPQTMLAIHYVTIGVANPVGFAALRFQAVAIAFPPEWKGDRRTLWYAVCAGAVLGAALLLFSTPVVADRYFGDYQNVRPEHLGFARAAIGSYCVWVVLQAVRARVEGLAAVRKRPSAIMAGQFSYLISLVAALAVMLRMDVIGWKMAVMGIYAATACATLAVYAALAAASAVGKRRHFACHAPPVSVKSTT